MGVFLAMLILLNLLGCQKTPEDEDVVGLSISCTHMVYAYSYSFSIYIKNDVTYFSCMCAIDKENDKYKMVTCKNVEIDSKYFYQLKDILKENNITEEVLKSKKKMDLFFVRDKTTYNISLTFKNDKYKSALLHFDEVYEFLKHLAGIYATEVTYE